MTIHKKGHRTAAESFPLYGHNIFPAAWPMIRDWDELIWHPGASSPRSSQALAIDVFGAIHQSVNGDAILDALAQELGLPTGGPWSMDLEAPDLQNTLKEVQSSPIDVVLRSPRVLLFLECKFTEHDGGRCQQVKFGKHPAQCSGNYAMQINPRNGLESRCALTAKGTRYWDIIPEVFNFKSDEDHYPCPFAGPWYQWMRIATVCVAVARHEHRQAAFAVVYVDRKGLAMARKDWSPFRAALRSGPIVFNTITFQRVLALAEQAALQDTMWPGLTDWVEKKIAGV